MRNDTTTARAGIQLVQAAAMALKARIDEVNRLNVFPVPDGDTGTNMSLTMDTVVRELAALPSGANLAEVCHAITHGSLLGARGNSGVILSQILRGLAEGAVADDRDGTDLIAHSLRTSVDVAFHAVRKPVEGTILTVIRDCAEAAEAQAAAGAGTETALDAVVRAAFQSVQRTPELLPVLKENGVVDAGGFGLALLIEGFVAAALGTEPLHGAADLLLAGGMHVVPVDDWDDQEFLYCTEFLLFGDSVDLDAVNAFLSQIGGSELIVGAAGEYKVHVHTNDPGAVLAQMTTLGELAEVHVNNMRRQQADRDDELRTESASTSRKPLGVVAVAAGKGLQEILRSLGVDVVVGGGQTMNPSTEDLLNAVNTVNADAVIILPNNKNIIMAANAVVGLAEKDVRVVPTTSVPAAFSALLSLGPDGDVDEVASAMAEAAAYVSVGEVTTAVKDAKGKVGAISAGQVIGIVDDSEIEFAGDDVEQVAFDLARRLGRDADTLAIFAGEDFTDAQTRSLSERIAAALPDLEIEIHRGEQPLYPVILSAE